MNPSTACPECGARAGACESRFNEFLALEFTDPAYGAMHYLTVAAYMRQHSSKLTREEWLYERELLNEFLVNNLPPAKMRGLRRNAMDSGKRVFKIASHSGEPVIPKTGWTKTVMDVNPASAESYCRDVRSWATAVLADTQRIVC
jgi:hypothetical protein